jgi:hypothetical protein
MWIEALREVRNPCGQRFEIRDGAGRVVLDLPFSEVIDRGNATRPPPNFAVLRQMTKRALGLQIEISAQIIAARKQLGEARELIARLNFAGRQD